jgi:hypothetical protein
VEKIMGINYILAPPSYKLVVPWLRWLVAVLSPWKLGLCLGQSMWDLWLTKWHWDRFFSKFFIFPLSVSFHHDSILIYHLGDEQWTWTRSYKFVTPISVNELILIIYI